MNSEFRVVHWELTPFTALSGTHATATKHFYFHLLRHNETKKVVGLRFTWRLRLTTDTKQLILSYIGEDDILFESISGIKQLNTMINTSYARFSFEYGIRALKSSFYYKMPPLNEGEIDLSEILSHLRKG